MKIDEGCIDHNITECIKELSLSDWGLNDSAVDGKQYLIGFIDGLVTLGECLKEVLRT